MKAKICDAVLDPKDTNFKAIHNSRFLHKQLTLF